MPAAEPGRCACPSASGHTSHRRRACDGGSIDMRAIDGLERRRVTRNGRPRQRAASERRRASPAQPAIRIQRATTAPGCSPFDQPRGSPSERARLRAPPATRLPFEQRLRTERPCSMPILRRRAAERDFSRRSSRSANSARVRRLPARVIGSAALAVVRPTHPRPAGCGTARTFRRVSIASARASRRPYFATEKLRFRRWPRSSNHVAQ